MKLHDNCKADILMYLEKHCDEGLIYEDDITDNFIEKYNKDIIRLALEDLVNRNEIKNLNHLYAPI